MSAPKPFRQDGPRIVDANGALVTLISCSDETAEAIIRAVNSEQTLRDYLKRASDYADGIATMREKLDDIDKRGECSVKNLLVDIAANERAIARILKRATEKL